MLCSVSANDSYASNYHTKNGPASATANNPYDESKEKLVNDKITIRKRLNIFAEKTSCHGLQGISRDVSGLSKRSSVKRAVWLILTLSSFGMACVSLGNIVADFLQYPTTTLIGKNVEEIPQFPSVTICNLNFADPDKLVSQFPELKWLGNEIGLNSSMTLNFKSRQEQDIRSIISSLFNIMSYEEKQECGHGLQDMLLDCRFEGQSCSAQDFVAVYNYNYGMCYSFNSGQSQNGSKQEIRRLDKIGEGNGLVLILDARSDRYIPASEQVGMKLMVHTPAAYPYMREEGISVAPGYQTNLGLSKEEVVEAEAPYGNCIPVGSEEDRKRNMYSLEGLGYTSMACIKSCHQAYIMNVCNCCDNNIPCNPGELSEMFGVILPKHSEGEHKGTLPACNGRGPDFRFSWGVLCALYVVSNVTRDMTCEKHCPSECQRVSYNTRLSLATWPNRILAERLYDEVDGRSRVNTSGFYSFTNNATSDQKISFVRENVLKLDVHFVSKSTLVISTKPVYTWSLLLCNIGGQLGLWLGFSLLTAFEFLELLLDTVTHGIKTLLERKRK